MNPTKNSIQFEIDSKFPGMDPRLKANLVEVSFYLSQEALVREGLEQLERRVMSRALGLRLPNFIKSPSTDQLSKKRAAVIDYYRNWGGRHEQRMAGASPNKRGAPSHLITKELTAIEKSAGFTSQDRGFLDHPYKVLLMMPLNGTTFLNNLKKGRHWKDIVGVNHGEYTHRLQWALIALSKVVKDPVKLFKAIPSIPTGSCEGRKFSAWDAICDRDPAGSNPQSQYPFKAASALDFRGPEMLLTWLCAPAQQERYPLVGGFFKYRKEKRAYYADNDFGAEKYLALKLYGFTGNIEDYRFEEQLRVYVQSGTSAEKADIDNEVGLLEPHMDSYFHKQLPKKNS